MIAANKSQKPKPIEEKGKPQFWLKDRKGKGLSSEEVAHYTRVITAIAETISIQGFLDDLFAQVETSLLEVRL